MGWVLCRRSKTGECYVTPPNAERDYTSRLDKARVWVSRKAAEAEADPECDVAIELEEKQYGT